MIQPIANNKIIVQGKYSYGKDIYNSIVIIHNPLTDLFSHYTTMGRMRTCIKEEEVSATKVLNSLQITDTTIWKTHIYKAFREWNRSYKQVKLQQVQHIWNDLTPENEDHSDIGMIINSYLDTMNLVTSPIRKV